MREEPSAITNHTLEPEAEGGARKTEKEAPEWARNLLEKRRSWRYTREDSGAPTGMENASSCQAASSPTSSRDHNISELSQHESSESGTCFETAFVLNTANGPKP